MALVASDILSSVRDELLDAGVAPAQTWTDATLLRWLSEALAAAVTLKRDIAPQIVPIPLATGSVQQVPSSGPNCAMFMQGYYNTSSGNAVTPGGVLLLSRKRPGWRATAPTVDVIEYEADHRSPTYFHVFPPNNGTGNLTGLCGIIPVVTAVGNPIVVPDHYRSALMHGVVAKAYGASTRRNDVPKMMAHWQMFEAMILGGKTAQIEVSPGVTDMSEAPG
jgi:hypothetical protein